MRMVVVLAGYRWLADTYSTSLNMCLELLQKLIMHIL